MSHPKSYNVRVKAVPRCELVCPKDFMKSWNTEVYEALQINPHYSEVDQLVCIGSRTGIAESVINELAEITGPQSLLCGKEPRSAKELFLLSEAPGVELECVKYQMEEVKRRVMHNPVKLAARRAYKYSGNDVYKFPQSTSEDPPVTDPKNKIQVPNVVLTVEVSKTVIQGSGSKKCPFSETFLILGTQTLADLRDAMQCPVENLIAGDYSTLPDVDPDTLRKAGDIYKSSFFFIEDVFYNDFRLPDNKDYSEPILEWAKEEQPETEMKKAKMEDTKLCDLTFRLGTYYLFTHQGNCEHSVLFTDMRMFSAADIQDLSKYPVLSAHKLQLRKVCHCCTSLTAKWVVFDSPLIPHEPCFLCEKCFKTLLYDKAGNKTSNFRACHYTEGKS